MTARLQLASLARQAATTADGVLGLAPGPAGQHVTQLDGMRVDGVVVVASDELRYGLELHLVAELVPLPELGAAVRERVLQTVSVNGLDTRVSHVDVVFEDVQVDDSVVSTSQRSSPGIPSRAAT